VKCAEILAVPIPDIPHEDQTKSSDVFFQERFQRLAPTAEQAARDGR